MKVETAIAHLRELDPTSDIMVQWFTKDHVETNTNTVIPEHIWTSACQYVDSNNPDMLDFHVDFALNWAEEENNA